MKHRQTVSQDSEYKLSAVENLTQSYHVFVRSLTSDRPIFRALHSVAVGKNLLKVSDANARTMPIGAVSTPWMKLFDELSKVICLVA